MVAHSIIIPHRDRHATLEVCLFSIELSARITNLNDYEVLVVDNGSQSTKFIERLGKQYPKTRWLINRESMEEFNKPILQNHGIDKARGDVLTFIDADAVAGPWFLAEHQRLLDHPEISKLCYRVRFLPLNNLKKWQDTNNRDKIVREWFDDYGKRYRAYEAYGAANRDSKRGDEGHGELYGNSHWSCRKEVLGDAYFDEEMSGHGYEDLLQLWYFRQQRGDAYRPVLVDDSVLCLQHLYNDNRWMSRAISRRNEAMFMATVEGKRAYHGRRKSVGCGTSHQQNARTGGTADCGAG